MRAVLSTIGSRGDVQPLVALALELSSAGAGVRLCAPPDFREWIEQLGLEAVPIGPEVHSTAKAGPPASPVTPERRRQMIEGTVSTQFETIALAARGCDVIVGATALQVAAPSVAEHMGIPYIFAAYCPAVLPLLHHAPPVLPVRGDTPASVPAEYGELWARDARRWSDDWAPIVNAQRASLGLRAVSDVRRYVLTDQPWLAADPTLAPWPEQATNPVFQPGAWLLPDDRPLDAGIDEVNQQALFPRVAAVVHHGGAGTTTAAARAGVPQVVIPQHYDQHYWAQRVQALGIGEAHDGRMPTTGSLTSALHRALRPDVARRAAAAASLVRHDGERIGARRLIAGNQDAA